LFQDFASDRQSLFDIFPNMSQDTFDILVHCLAIEPDNRSLQAAREAVMKAICFTTDDESLDEFCANTAPVVTATANREPLRTPSIASPHFTSEAFPWAKNLALTQPARQLSVIADNELSDEMFPEPQPTEWYKQQPDNASLVSFVDSGLGVSIKSTEISIEKDIHIPRSKPMAIAGSLPTSMSRLIPSFMDRKRRAAVSKSWSDMMDEDYDTDDDDFFFESDRLEPVISGETIDDSINGDDTPRAMPLEPVKADTLNKLTGPSLERKSEDRMSDHNVFIFEDHQDNKAIPNKDLSSESNVLDKWAALGRIRRAFRASQHEKTLSPANEKLPSTGAVQPLPISPITVPRKRRAREAVGSTPTHTSRNLNWNVLRHGGQRRNRSFGSPNDNNNNNKTINANGNANGKASSPDLDQEWYKSKDWRKPVKYELVEGRDLLAQARRPIEWVWRG